jgi:transcriptional regulator with XRE-family HTH domain
MDWATKLKVMRTARGLSQLDLANIAQINNKDLSAYETGRALPPPEWERVIKLGLGWPAEELAEIAFAILGGTLREWDVTDLEDAFAAVIMRAAQEPAEAPRPVGLGVTGE